MRRALAATVLGAALLATPWVASTAGAFSCAGPPAVVDVYEARAEAGGVHDSVAVPAYFETFLPYSLDEASNGSAHGYHSTFYGGFFLTAAGEQYLGQYGLPTKPPGTTETLYPQGPTTASAAFVPIPGADQGSSHGTSSATGSQGTAAFGGGAFGAQGSIGFGETTTSVMVGSVVRSQARVAMHDLQLGPLSIGAVDGTAEAVSGARRGTGKASASLTFADATVLGVPVVIKPSGTEIAGTPVPPYPSGADLLKQAGLTIEFEPQTKRVAASGTDSRIEISGVKVTFSQPAQEFTVTWTLGRVKVLARGLPPLPTPCVGGLLPGIAGGVEEQVAPGVAGSSSVSPPVAPAVVEPVTVSAGGGELRRVRRTSSAGTLDVTWLAASIALLAVFASLARRAFHAVASP